MDMIKVENLNALEVFTSGGIGDILQDIHDKATDFTPDTTTDKGRKLIASQAHAVSKSKVLLDNVGKGLVSEWKQKSKLVDASRKEARDYCDNLRDTVRQPLTDWEQAIEVEKERHEKAVQFRREFGQALISAAMDEKQKELERINAKIEAEKLEAERIEQEKQAEQERIEREAQIAKEATERAEKEAAAKIEAEKIARIAAEQRAKLDAERLEREKIEAVEAVKREEQARIAKEQREKEAAALELKKQEEKKAANKAHQKKVNNAAATGLLAAGIDSDTAQQIIKLIAQGKIEHVTITY